MQDPKTQQKNWLVAEDVKGETINACSLRRLVVILLQTLIQAQACRFSALKTNTKWQDRRSGRWTSCATKSQLIYYDGSG